MPLMMDDQQYVMDDLFGDSGSVHIPAMVPPIKGLAQRIDELQEIGCCQKITWSKTGCVAAIIADGRGVELSAFHRSPLDGTWKLGEKVPLNIPSAQDEFPYIHIAWGHLGNDLVVIDSAGRVSIFTTMYALARMNPARTQFVDHEDEMGAVVGMHWLALIPHQHKNHIPWSAERMGEEWQFPIVSHTFNHAHHPKDSKAGFITLGRSGALKLRYQQIDSTWLEASTEITHINSAQEAFTHAAFAPDNDNSLLLVAHTVIGHLYIYRIRIDWHVPPVKNMQQSQTPLLPPNLEVMSLLVEDRCYPESSASLDGLTSGPEQKIQIPAQLTHLSFLPTTPEPDSADSPTILATFAHCPSPISSLDQTQPPQNSFSIVARWELHQSQNHHLHPNIDQVSSKRKSVGGVPARATYRLKRLPDFMTNSLILSSFPIFYNTTLAFCQSDGTIDFRNRATLDVITPDYNQNRVSSLSQAGFAFSNLEPSLHISLSANHCMAVAMKSDGEYKLKSMEYTLGSLKSIDEDAKQYAAIAALVLQHTTAANQYFTSDDILAILDPEISDATKRAFISQAFKALGVTLDCVSEDAHNNAMALLSRSTQFVKCLSAQVYFGSSPSPTGLSRSLPAKLAWVVLNMRYVTQIMNTMMRMHNPIDRSPPRPDIATSLLGLCRWMMHLMVWILDDLMTLGKALRKLPPPMNTTYDRALLQARIDAAAAPALPLLLASFPRTMFKIWQQALGWISRYSIRLAQTAPTPEVRAIYQPLQVAFAECPFDWRRFDAIHVEATANVKSCYQRAGYSDEQRKFAEKELIMGIVPDVLMPAARRLLGGFLFDAGGLLDKLDPARIMFADTRWLGLDNSLRTREWQHTHVVDVCQKLVMKPKRETGKANPSQKVETPQVSMEAEGVEGREEEERLRRCTRCAAFMEDVTHSRGSGNGQPNHGGAPTWVVGIGKHCVCQGGWMLVGWPEGMAGE